GAHGRPPEDSSMPLVGVNIAHMVINAHGPIFADLIELLTHSLQQLGLHVLNTPNSLFRDRLNIIIGHTVCLQEAAFAAFQNSRCAYVVFQTEALDTEQGLAPLFPS